MKNIRIPVFLGLFGAIALMVALPAQARVHWLVNIGIGGFGYYPAPRVYLAPRAYYYPAPAVVYRPAPVYVQPQVIYQQPVVIYNQAARSLPSRHYEAASVVPNGVSYRRSYREYRDYRR